VGRQAQHQPRLQPLLPVRKTADRKAKWWRPENHASIVGQWMSIIFHHTVQTTASLARNTIDVEAQEMVQKMEYRGD
jgi:hypothetical protein